MRINKPVKEVLAAIEALDLDPIKFKLMDPEEGQGWSREYVESMAVAYKRFLSLLVCHPDETIAPTKDIDKFWHGHILDTMKYAEDCQNVFGGFLHHFPYFGMRGEQDARDLARAGEAMSRLYSKEFGEGLPAKPSFCYAAAEPKAEPAFCYAAVEAQAPAFCYAAVESDKPSFCYAAVEAQAPAFCYAAVEAQKPSFCYAAVEASKPAFCYAAVEAQAPAFCYAAVEASKPAFCYAAVESQKAAFCYAAVEARSPAFCYAAVEAQKPAFCYAAVSFCYATLGNGGNAPAFCYAAVSATPDLKTRPKLAAV